MTNEELLKEIEELRSSFNMMKNFVLSMDKKIEDMESSIKRRSVDIASVDEELNNFVSLSSPSDEIDYKEESSSKKRINNIRKASGAYKNSLKQQDKRTIAGVLVGETNIDSAIPIASFTDVEENRVITIPSVSMEDYTKDSDDFVIDNTNLYNNDISVRDYVSPDNKQHMTAITEDEKKQLENLGWTSELDDVDNKELSLSQMF